MKALYEKLRLIVPEAEESLVKRSNILQMVLRYQPIGRQSLAEKLQMTERPLRTETNQLKELGLLESTRTGMRITPLGGRNARICSEFTSLEFELIGK